MAPFRGVVLNSRTIAAPLAAVVMAGLLYTYSVTSIRAAKRNARLHREADGGQLDMRKESLRRHGVLSKVEGTNGFALMKDSAFEGESGATATNNSQSKRSRRSKGVGAADGGGDGDEVPVPLSTRGTTSRTETERELEEYKKRGTISDLAIKPNQSER